jgi:hypothetical protein
MMPSAVDVEQEDGLLVRTKPPIGGYKEEVSLLIAEKSGKVSWCGVYWVLNL